MGNTAPTRLVLPEPTSFVYEDLISHVQTMQKQIIKITKFLDNQLKNEGKIQNQLKSRSFIFRDPYGNSIVNRYMDHQLISTVLKIYKNNYIQEYLREYIRIGTMNENHISSLDESQLRSNVFEYDDRYQFVAYVEVIVWIGDYEYLWSEKLILQVLPTCTLTDIKIQIEKSQKYKDIELRLFTINENSKINRINWNEGTPFKSDDTIMSCKLYTNNCVILAKSNVSDVRFFFFFQLYIIRFCLFLKGSSFKYQSFYANICENAYWVHDLFNSKV
jgi:hypothetical protein